jgi:hypothetical protein
MPGFRFRYKVIPEGPLFQSQEKQMVKDNHIYPWASHMLNQWGVLFGCQTTPIRGAFGNVSTLTSMKRRSGSGFASAIQIAWNQR